MLQQLNKNLLHLAWSLWTELGVAGVQQHHQNVLIWIEELILFTNALSEIDPRLRDESSDWCTKFHHFISTSRLKSLAKDFKLFVNEPLGTTHLSHKSILRPHASAALLNIRARSIFGTGARADLVTFFLTHPNRDFSIAEVAEIGYSKRNFSDILDDLHSSHLFDRFMQGNQLRYRLKPNSPLLQMLQPIPKFAPPWRLIFLLLLIFRDCVQRIENQSLSTKVVTIRNCLKEQEKLLQKLGISPPPPFQNDLVAYLEHFTQWLLEWTDPLNVYKSSS